MTPDARTAFVLFTERFKRMNRNVKPYLIVIYGKDGCDMCAHLKDEVSVMLDDEKLKDDFDLDYQNLSTVEGMTAYALSETVNGQRIPALQIMKYNREKKSYVKIPDRRQENLDEKTGSLFVPVYLQLQTEYGSSDPVIKKSQVRQLMSLAKESI